MQKEKRNTNTNTNTKIGTWIETHLEIALIKTHRRSFVWDFANKILIQAHKPLRTLETLDLNREWWNEKVNGYLECWVYDMSESVKRIWRLVRVNWHSAEAWWFREKSEAWWWSEKLNGYLECWVYEMTKSVKRIWRWVRVNRQRQRLGDSDSGLVIGEKSKAWWQRLGDQREKRGLEIAAWWLERKREARWRERETGDGSPVL